jgi:hypothetical protein
VGILILGKVQKYKQLASIVLSMLLLNVFLSEAFHYYSEEHHAVECTLVDGQQHLHSDDHDHNECAFYTFQLQLKDEIHDPSWPERPLGSHSIDGEQVAAFYSKAIHKSRNDRAPPLG